MKTNNQTKTMVSTLTNWLIEQEEREEAPSASRRLHLHFLQSPVEVLGEDGKVTGLKVERNELDGNGGARGTGAAQASAKAPLVIDLDATLINVHSEKEQAAPTFKRGFGYHPLCAFLDHGSRRQGTGEPLAIALRPGNASSNPASDHITVTRQALAPAPTSPACPGRAGLEEDLDPHRRGRRHQGLHRLADHAASGLLGRVHPSRHTLLTCWNVSIEPMRGLPPTTPRTTGSAMGHGSRSDQAAGPYKLARGDASDRAEGTTPPRSAAADHRSRGHADHRVRETDAPRGQLPVLELVTVAVRAARTGSGTRRTWD